MKDNEIELQKGVFTLSLDTELAWGAIDLPRYFKENKPYYEKTREIIDKILSLMVKYNISATWAIVGHLFLDKCEVIDSKKHFDIPRSHYIHYKEDWFELCPCSNLKDAPLWYGKDIINKIINCETPQEIGSHSFCHILYGNKNTKLETIIMDLKKSIEEASKLDLEMKSFVFPRNNIGYLSELKKAGYEIYRGIEPSWYSRYPHKVKKLFHILDQALAITPSVNHPFYNEGIINIPASMLYLSMDGFRRYIPVERRIIKAQRGIKAAIKEQKVFHLWFHPFNIATNPEQLLYGLEQIFSKVDTERKKGNIEVLTMKEIIKVVN